MGVIIRTGNKKDVPSILGLIKELALYERAPELVLNTEKMLLEDGFGEQSIYNILVAEQADTETVIGMALYFTAYSTWNGRIFYLDDLVVTESHRRFGIGRLLMNEFLQVAKQAEVNEVRWQVLNWNLPAIEFYKSLNVKFDADWINCSLTKNQILNITN